VRWSINIAGGKRHHRSELEVERSVRDRLYRERAEVRAAPKPAVSLHTGRRASGADPRGAVLLGRPVGGRYRLLERLGSGGMASVHRARDERLKRDVAVKVVAERFARDADFVRRFRREAEVGARLTHPNLVAVLDAGVEPQDFIVMELVHGHDTRTLVRREGPLTPGEAVHVIAQVCDALAYAHDHGVIHHDVSLGNILIRRPDGTAKLADFGLASDGLDLLETPEKQVTGTPGYVAPEILSGASPSPRSDLYSLAVTAYLLLAGPARMRSNGPDATAPLATAVPRIPRLAAARPGLPRALNDAVQRALADDPDARQDSVREFRGQLVGAVRAPHRPEQEIAPAIPRQLPSAA
jgi:eukaryotic-like serine/threonine-protein kinase